MGVRGLEKFLYEHPECIKPVNMEELALAYREKFKINPKLLIDTNSCLFFLMCTKPWVSGYQLKVMASTLEMLIKRIQSIGIEVTSFIGGIDYPAKFDGSMKKQQERISEAIKIFNLIRSNQDEISKVEYQEMYSANVKSVIIDCFKKCGCQIFQSTKGRTQEGALYAKNNQYFGVLAQESDFVIHNCATYYFSMKKLDLKTLNTVCYRPDALAGILNLNPGQLPLLATIMGNRVTYSRSIIEFHQSLFRESERFSRSAAFFKVAQFIKYKVNNYQSLITQLPGLSKIIFRTADNSYSLKNGLLSYNVVLQEENAVDHWEEPKWDEFKKLTVELHKAAKLPHTVYQIVTQLKFFHRVDMTDPDKKNNQKWFEIAQILRRKIYGVILLNKPQRRGRSGSIKEIYIDINLVKKENYVKVIYPEMKVDVHKLWLDVDGIYIEEKWNLFYASLKIPRDTLCVEEIHLLIPVVSLKYLLMNRFEIAAWELEALLASMLLLQYYSVEDLEAIPEFPLDADAIHLYWFLVKIFDLVAILNSVCGFPLDSGLASPIHYQDGKLFHHKYREAKENKSFENLCEFRGKEINSGKKILAMIRE